jgi:hypothetical protein
MNARSFVMAVAAAMLAVTAAGVASGAPRHVSALRAVAVTLSAKGAVGGRAQEHVGQAVTLVASSTKLPKGDRLMIEGKRQGQSTWFKVAGCASMHCTGSHAEQAAGTDVFQAFAVRKGGSTPAATDGRSKPVTVTWQAPLPTISIANATTGPTYTAPTTTLSFPVTLSAASTKAVSVSYATADGGAKAGNDYTAASGTLTFNPGETSKTVDVTITADKVLHGDDAAEASETFTVTLSNPVNATIATGSATGTIANDDPPTPMPGHYAGQTSQGYGISFDVSPDGSSLTGANLTIDSDCGQYGTIEFSGDWGQPIALNVADWSFSDALGADAPDGSAIRIYLRGNVTLDGKAQGSLQAQVVLQSAGITCDSGTVTFTATHS